MSKRRKKTMAMKSPGRPVAGKKYQSTVYGHWRFWSRWLAVLGVLVLITVGVNDLYRWILSSKILPIRVVRVEGSGLHIQPEHVQRVVQSTLKGGFFGVNLNALARALEALPWVYHANVERRWPDTLIIRLYPQRAVAYWNKHALLNFQGRVFKPPASTFPKGLPSIKGPRGKEHKLMQRYQTAQQLFAPDGLRVSALDEDERRAYRLWFSNGIELVVGRDWNMQRMTKLATVYEQVLAPKAKRIKRIDLRYPNGFAVAWKHSKTNGARTPGKE